MAECLSRRGKSGFGVRECVLIWFDSPKRLGEGVGVWSRGRSDELE